jgi:hypothetical protein
MEIKFLKKRKSINSQVFVYDWGGGIKWGLGEYQKVDPWIFPQGMRSLVIRDIDHRPGGKDTRSREPPLKGIY